MVWTSIRTANRNKNRHLIALNSTLVRHILMYSTVHYNTLQYDTQEHAEISVLTAKYSKLHYSTVRNKQYTLHYSTEHYRQCSTTNRNRNKILPTVHIVHLSRLYYSTVNSTLYSIVQVS